MTTTTSDDTEQTRASRSGTSHQAAAITSEVFAPWIFAGVMPPVVGAMTSEPWWHGLLIGLMVTTLTAVVPYVIIHLRVRNGSYSDRHLVRRQDRPRFLAMVVGLTILALSFAHFFDGSRPVQVFIVLVLITAAVGAVVSRWWKISMHTLVMTASLMVLIALERGLTPLAALLPLVIWARLRLGVHSVAQLLTGAAAGAALGIAASLIS